MDGASAVATVIHRLRGRFENVSDQPDDVMAAVTKEHKEWAMQDETMTNGSDQQEHADTASMEETAKAGSPPEQEAGGRKRVRRIERWTETVTAIMLGIVAIATAWSG